MLLNDDGRLIIGKGVQLKPYQPRPLIHREFMTQADIQNNVGTDLILDGEFYPNYAMFGFKSVKLGKYLRFDNSFNPRLLSWLLFNYRTVGFNSILYDLPMIWAWFFNDQPEFLKAVSNALIQSEKRTNEIEREFGFTCYKIPKRSHVDLFNVCPLKGSLKLYGARLHSKRIQDLPFPDYEPLDDWQKPIVDDYNYNDLDVTELIFNFCKERLELREHISTEYGEDLMSKSDAQMAEVVISKEVGKLNKRWVKRPEIEGGTIYKYSIPKWLNYKTPPLQKLLEAVRRADFIVQDSGKIKLPSELDIDIKVGNGIYRLGIGGLHSSEKSVTYRANAHTKLIDRDVKSYYPRIITNLGLYPIAMGPNFLTVYNGFIHQRLVAKATKNFTKDKGLKIFINGTSGKFSDFWSKMYSPDLTIQVTVTGQLGLLLFIEMLTVAGFEVISANTDGVVTIVPTNRMDNFNEIVKQWENITDFETEDTEYGIYCARDVNAYFAVKKDAKSLKDVKVKGPYSEVGSQSGTQLDNNPIHLICSDAIKLFLIDGTPYEKTIRECTDITRFIVVRNVKGGAAFRGEYLGKVVRWYYSNKSYDCIQYISSGNKVAETDNCIPCMDLPAEIPSDLNYQWYIDKCIDILTDVGYYKKVKQVNFF